MGVEGKGIDRLGTKEMVGWMLSNQVVNGEAQK